MKVTKLDIIDWEPVFLAFHFTGLTKNRFRLFENMVTECLKGAREHRCSCGFNFAHCTYDQKRNTVALESKWMCFACVQLLADVAAAEFPELDTVKLGKVIEETPTYSVQFIEIQQKEIQMENGNKYLVRPFCIAKTTVSVGAFEAFALETGYLTSAERDQHFENYRNNQLTEGLSPKGRRSAAAVYISYNDAIAFCNHRGYRLPTEAEWLAAAVNDWREREVTPYEEFQLRKRPLSANLIEVGDIKEWTSDETQEGAIVVRGGPTIYIDTKWRTLKEMVNNKRTLVPSEYEIWLSFRVAKT